MRRVLGEEALLPFEPAPPGEGSLMAIDVDNE